MRGARRALAALAVALVAAAPPPVKVPPRPATTSAVVRPSAAEALALVQACAPRAVRRDAEIAAVRTGFIAGHRANPAMAALFDGFPTLGPSLVDTLIAHIDLYMDDYVAAFEPRATTLVRDRLSRSDTLALTEMYQRPVIVKYMRIVATQVDGTAMVAKATEGKKLDIETAGPQAAAAAFRGYAALSTEDRAEIAAAFSSPLFKRFAPVAEELATLQVAVMNEPKPTYTPAVDAALRKQFKAITGLDP